MDPLGYALKNFSPWAKTISNFDSLFSVGEVTYHQLYYTALLDKA